MLVDGHQGAWFGGTRGVSIYLPVGACISPWYPKLAFADDTQWDEMLVEYRQQIWKASEAGLAVQQHGTGTHRFSNQQRRDANGQLSRRVLHSPAGEMTADQATPIEYDDKQLQSSLDQLEQRELDTDGLVALGRTLAGIMLPTDGVNGRTGVRELFALSVAGIPGDSGLRLMHELSVIPWEYMFVEARGSALIVWEAPSRAMNAEATDESGVDVPPNDEATIVTTWD